MGSGLTKRGHYQIVSHTRTPKTRSTRHMPLLSHMVSRAKDRVYWSFTARKHLKGAQHMKQKLTLMVITLIVGVFWHARY